MNLYPSFYDLADQVADKKQFNEIYAKQLRFFQINPYKIEKLYSETAKKIYSQILNKYQVTKEFKVSGNCWQQNQRRVFVWYMIILVELQSLNFQKRNQIQWAQLSIIFFDKNPQFLEFQFANILKTKNKITWIQEEDAILLEAMTKEKPGKWNQVSKRIFYESDCKTFKSPKHCRQRWFNHLDQSKNKGYWTLQQDYAIFKFILQNGKRWACIVKQLQNSRTQHMIKNRYNSLISKLKKNKKRRQEQIAEIVFKSLEAEVKNERKQRKSKSSAILLELQKQQILQEQNLLQQNAQKQEVSDQIKSQNSTLKNIEVKVQEVIRQSDKMTEEKSEIQNKSDQEILFSNVIQNHHMMGLNMMPIQPCQFFYFGNYSAFAPVNPFFAYSN